MYTSLIVPLDGTPLAETALVPARELARLFGSRLVVVRAVPPPRDANAVDGEARQCEAERLDDADGYLHGVVASLRDDGIDADLLVYMAAPDGAIARAAELRDADLVIMAAHLRGAGAIASGGTTLRLLDESTVPVLVWHPRPLVDGAAPSGEGRGHPPLASPTAPIVVPLDGSPFAERALLAAEELAAAYSSSIVLARAVEGARDPFHFTGSARTADDYAIAERATIAHLKRAHDAGEYLARLGDSARNRGAHVLTAVRAGAPTAVVDSVCREYHAGLVVIATHSHSWLMGRLLSNVTANVIERVSAPILVLRPEGIRRPTLVHAGDRPGWHRTPEYVGGI